MEVSLKQKKYSYYNRQYLERDIKKCVREISRAEKLHTLRNFKCVCNLVQIPHEHYSCVESQIPTLWYLAAEKYCDSILNRDSLDIMVSMRLHGIHILGNYLLISLKHSCGSDIANLKII